MEKKVKNIAITPDPKRLHDLTNSLQTLRLLISALKAGYRFDDATAAEKIQRLESVLLNLEKEGAFIKELLS